MLCSVCILHIGVCDQLCYTLFVLLLQLTATILDVKMAAILLVQY